MTRKRQPEAPAEPPAPMQVQDFGAGTPAVLHGREAVGREPDFLWAGRPVYRCRKGCNYERVEGLEAVLRHEVEAHATPAPVERQSSILGPNGETVVVREVEKPEE